MHSTGNFDFSSWTGRHWAVDHRKLTSLTSHTISCLVCLHVSLLAMTCVLHIALCKSSRPTGQTPCFAVSLMPDESCNAELSFRIRSHFLFRFRRILPVWNQQTPYRLIVICRHQFPMEACVRHFEDFSKDFRKYDPIEWLRFVQQMWTNA